MSSPYIGEIRLFGFSRTPQGWQPCDGSILPISNYDTLFSLIGTTYGGDGQNTFAVPDLRGQVPLHQGQGQGLTMRTIGERAGAENVTLLPAQMPAHVHSLSATTLAANATAPSGTVELGSVSGDTLYATDLGVGTVGTSVASTTPAGGTQPHDNLMPTLTVQFCIALEGIYPQQN
ncbi:phage tail protein [Agrilutibacter solisilvae]|uniref:Phage tail protein n=1 Tax=Agrilutibacter solisilvae TaxID=2763317 RepID=A0A974XZW1_9GAMM|nr:tail fiber protein [Lysobacter solisilvae]QSX78020.1 phage tail protein [Lysobacter solisilvae]